MHIVPIGGGPTPLVWRYIYDLTGQDRPTIAYIAAASGDDINDMRTFYYAHKPYANVEILPLFNRQHGDLEAFFSEVDMVVCSGGNTVNLCAILKAHAVPEAIRRVKTKPAKKNLVLTGWSAGGLCWFDSGVTDSFGDGYKPFYDGLRFISGSFCPHANHEGRHESFFRFIKGRPLGGVAADDPVALHYEDGKFIRAVSASPDAKAARYYGDGKVEIIVPDRLQRGGKVKKVVPKAEPKPRVV